MRGTSRIVDPSAAASSQSLNRWEGSRCWAPQIAQTSLRTAAHGRYTHYLLLTVLVVYGHGTLACVRKT